MSRPTNLRFRSPKELTAEFVVPQVHYDGKNLSYLKLNTTRGRLRSPEETKRFSTFSTQDRFHYKKVKKIMNNVCSERSVMSLLVRGPTTLIMCTSSCSEWIHLVEMYFASFKLNRETSQWWAWLVAPITAILWLEIRLSTMRLSAAPGKGRNTSEGCTRCTQTSMMTSP